MLHHQHFAKVSLSVVPALYTSCLIRKISKTIRFMDLKKSRVMIQASHNEIS